MQTCSLQSDKLFFVFAQLAVGLLQALRVGPLEREVGVELVHLGRVPRAPGQGQKLAAAPRRKRKEIEFGAVRNCVKSCRSRKMCRNEYVVTKISFDTAETEFTSSSTFFVNDVNREMKLRQDFG